MKIAPVQYAAKNANPPTPEKLEIEIKDVALKVILKPQDASRHSMLINTLENLSSEREKKLIIEYLNYLGSGSFNKSRVNSQ